MSEYTPSMDRVRDMYARIMKPDGTVALCNDPAYEKVFIRVVDREAGE